jgi:hypothetical protein
LVAATRARRHPQPLAAAAFTSIGRVPLTAHPPNPGISLSLAGIKWVV